MSTFNSSRTRAVQSLLLAGLLSLAAAPALAGECPADKVGPNSLPGAATAPVGVTEAELTSIDLSKESVNLPQRRLRYRHMEIAPGGIVPLHDHSDRPALIMVNQGKIFEYRMVIRTRDRNAAESLSQHLCTLPGIIEFRIAPTGD